MKTHPQALPKGKGKCICIVPLL